MKHRKEQNDSFNDYNKLIHQGIVALPKDFYKGW